MAAADWGAAATTAYVPAAAGAFLATFAGCWLQFCSPCSGCRCWLLLAEEPCKGLRLQLAADLFQLLPRKHLLRLAAGLLLLLLRWLLLLLLTAEMPS